MKTFLGLVWVFIMGLLLAMSIDGPERSRAICLNALLFLGLATIIASVLRR